MPNRPVYPTGEACPACEEPEYFVPDYLVRREDTGARYFTATREIHHKGDCPVLEATPT